MKFVNVHGQVIDPYRTPSALAPKKPKAKAAQAIARADFAGERLGTSKGWVVFAVDPKDLVAARALAKKRRLLFDEAAWLRKASPKKLRSQPYTLQSAAEQCAELARKAGFLLVRVEAAK